MIPSDVKMITKCPKCKGKIYYHTEEHTKHEVRFQMNPVLVQVATVSSHKYIACSVCNRNFTLDGEEF